MEANLSLMPFLTKYGINTISYNALHSDLNQWVDVKNGYASYATHLGYNFILGRPLCPPGIMPDVIHKIIDDLNKPAFIQIGKHVANILHENFGYKITKIGNERFLNIQKYNIENNPKGGRLRASVKRGLENAYFYELNQRQLEKRFGVIQKDLEIFSADWLQRKTLKKHIRFLIRKPVYVDEAYVRKFYSFDNKHNLLGFIFFSPIFKNNQIIGYCTDTMRAAKNAPYGHITFMILQAMDKFKIEGKHVLSLGLAPDLHPTDANFKKDFLTYQSIKLLYNHSNGYFNFKGIYNYKKQFGGTLKPSYIATKRRFPLLESYSLMHYMGFI